jgi:hypothetical protein
MALRIEARNIRGIKPSGRSNSDDVVIECDVTNAKELLAQICEYLGDDVYLEASKDILEINLIAPSDEEIKIGAESFIKNGNCSCKTCQAFCSDFIQGAKWMKEQVAIK